MWSKFTVFVLIFLILTSKKYKISFENAKKMSAEKFKKCSLHDHFQIEFEKYFCLHKMALFLSKFFQHFGLNEIRGVITQKVFSK